MACQFDVSAKAPADPDVRVEQYNGAKCNYTINEGVGENFEVSLGEKKFDETM